MTAQKRKSEERWQDNAEVTHCLQCKAEFSLFVRKVSEDVIHIFKSDCFCVCICVCVCVLNK